MSDNVLQLLSAVDALSESDLVEFDMEYASRRAKLLARLQLQAKAELGLESDDDIEAWSSKAVTEHRSRNRRAAS